MKYLVEMIKSLVSKLSITLYMNERSTNRFSYEIYDFISHIQFKMKKSLNIVYFKPFAFISLKKYFFINKISLSLKTK